jgi:hypothetical protein
MPYYGFNFQWVFAQEPGRTPAPADLQALDFLAEVGLNFVRLPCDYRFWTRGREYYHPDERVLEQIDGYLDACRQRGLHLSLNLHRAPGYCINRNDLEAENLWLSPHAQDAFVFQWELFARRYKSTPAGQLSFDLLNEPPGVGRCGLTRASHAALMRRAAAGIRAISPARPVVVDGLGGGHLAMPELADLGAVHSGRGYQPMSISHFQAPWWSDHAQCPPVPQYPGPGMPWDQGDWNRDRLRAFYQPWREVEKMGVTIHIGEFGCYNKTDNPVALRWLTDLMGVFQELGWGYALWEFQGPFGIVEHGRPNARYELFHGYPVDRQLLDVFLGSRVGVRPPAGTKS